MKVKYNTYCVVWKNVHTGRVQTSAKIDVPVHGDVIVEHILVLARFHTFFEAPPECVASIEEVKLMKKRKDTSPMGRRGRAMHIRDTQGTAAKRVRLPKGAINAKS